MSRNGFGTFAVLNPILIGALRASAAVNADCTDMGTAITGTLPLDGTVGLSGQFKAVDGTRAIPGIAFASDTNTGFRRNGADEMRWVGGGADRFYVDANGKGWILGDTAIAGALTSHGALTGAASDPILISQFATNGVAKRTANTPTWAPEAFTFLLSYSIHGGIQTGVLCDLMAPCGGTITSGAIMGNATGSCVVDVWKDTYANYPPTVGDTITGGSPLTISAGVGLLDTTLAGWTKTVTAGDCFRFNINSVSGFGRLTIALAIARVA